MSHIDNELKMDKDLNMHERYYHTANLLLDLADKCGDEEAVTILKNGSAKILELAQSHSGFIKTAQLKTGSDDAE